VTDSGNQTAQKTINVNIANNKAPVLSIANTTTPEKAAGKLSVTATDSDGSVVSYLWKQTAGPAVTLTGANTATPSFTAPAVTAQTNLSFSVKVSDDENDFTEATSNVTVEQKFISYTIEGTAPAAAFNNADVVLTSGDMEFTAKATAQGTFSLVAKTDDDAPRLSFGQLKVKSATIAGLEYYAFLRDLQPNALMTSAVSTQSTARTLSVNEASTALFALIKQANNNLVPADLNKYLFLEKSLVADELMEAAAVAKIAAFGVHKLPAGQSLLDVLANNSLYSNYVSAINAAEPDAVTKAIAAIIADPALTPPLSLAEIPSAYYQLVASGERFLSRVGTIYQLHKDGSGTRSFSDLLRIENLNWTFANGALELRFAPENATIAYVGLTHPSIQALGAATVKLLQDNNISQVAVKMGTAKVVLQRIIKGSQVDSFRITEDISIKVEPLTVAGQTLNPPAFIETFTSDQLLKSDAGNTLKYAASELNDTSLTIPHKYSLNISEVSYREQLQSDVLEFKANGSGKGKISEIAFTWQISADGKLTVTFADGDKTELTKFDEGFGYHSAIASIWDASGQQLATWGTWVVNHDVSNLEKGKNAVNTAGSYWQSMVNLWRKDCWKQDKLLLTCTSTPGFSQFFGWEINTWPSGAEHTGGTNGMTRTSRAVSWEYDNDWVVVHRRKCGSSDCSRRLWWGLKDETVNGKRHIWVLEGNASRVNDKEKYDIGIPFRITRIDQLPLNYPDSVAQQDINESRLLLEPNPAEAEPQQ
jgi:hypothetical protein